MNLQNNFTVLKFNQETRLDVYRQLMPRLMHTIVPCVTCDIPVMSCGLPTHTIQLLHRSVNPVIRMKMNYVRVLQQRFQSITVEQDGSRLTQYLLIHSENFE